MDSSVSDEVHLDGGNQEVRHSYPDYTTERHANSFQMLGPAVLDENLVHEVPYDSLCRTIRFINDAKTYVPQYFTYEGLRRCTQYGCRLLWSIEQHQCRDPIGRCFDQCDACWMPFPGGNAGVRQKARHTERCRGPEVRGAWAIAWDGTLHCPLCHCPGLTVTTMCLHLVAEGKRCQGDRRAVLGGGLLPKGLDPRSPRVCDVCGYTFHPAVFNTHVCGSSYDPIWLGEIGIPDMSKPYVAWCRDLPAPEGPCGLGGGYIGANPAGCIPDCVYEASWHVPFSTNLKYSLGPSSTLFELLSELRRLLSSDQSQEDSAEANASLEVRGTFHISFLQH